MLPKQKSNNKCDPENYGKIVYNRVFIMRGGYLFLDTFYPIACQSKIIIQIVSLFFSPAPESSGLAEMRRTLEKIPAIFII